MDGMERNAMGKESPPQEDSKGYGDAMLHFRSVGCRRGWDLGRITSLLQGGRGGALRWDSHYLRSIIYPSGHIDEHAYLLISLLSCMPSALQLQLIFNKTYTNQTDEAPLFSSLINLI